MAAEGLESIVFTLECRYILAGLGDILMGKIKQERERDFKRKGHALFEAFKQLCWLIK